MISSLFIDCRVPDNKHAVAGWGRTISRDTSNSQGFKTSAAYEQQLQILVLKDVYEASKCAELFRGYRKQEVDKTEGRVICARAEYVPSNPKDACSGDSGGPIYSSQGKNPQSDLKYLTGLVSVGTKQCGAVNKLKNFGYPCNVDIINTYF